MEYKDYYKILGVPRDADDKAVKTAYRKLARKHHPDVSKGSAERFKEISETGAGAGSPFEGRRVRFTQGAGDFGGFSDFFRTIFGDLGGGPFQGGFQEVELGDLGDLGGGFGGTGMRGGDVEAGIELTLEEAFRGVSRAISLELDEPCTACGGAGHVNRRPCAQCRGTGWSKGRRNLEVKIPAGVDTGSRVRVAGEGLRGAGRGGSGDLYLRVTVKPDGRFERKGDDLYVDLPVSAPDAALGTEASVPTLKGQVSMKIPPETSSGRTFRLPGYGMPRLKGGGTGDQYVRVQVTVGSGLTAREKALYEELRAEKKQ